MELELELELELPEQIPPAEVLRAAGGPPRPPVVTRR